MTVATGSNGKSGVAEASQDPSIRRPLDGPRHGNGNSRPSKPNFQPVWEFITPELAVEYLTKLHPRQRDLRKHHVDFFAQEIVHGRYEPTHEGIAFDCDDFLVDGQHRLYAIAKCGIGIWILVTRGVKSIMGMGIGMKRDTADLIRIRDGMTDGRTKVAIVRAMLAMLGYGDQRRSPALVADWYLDNAEDVDYVNAHNTGSRLRSAYIGAAFVLARKSCREDVDTFIDAYRDGCNLTKNAPALKLREWVGSRVMGGEGVRKEAFRKTLAALFAYARRRTLANLQESTEAVAFFLKPWRDCMAGEVRDVEEVS